ncbi:MAG: hypothetical protein N6V49_14450, partial [Serratia symbiotica]|nr:hypothetical protein [Serratia symbiotica]
LNLNYKYLKKNNIKFIFLIIKIYNLNTINIIFIIINFDIIFLFKKKKTLLSTPFLDIRFK